MNSGKARGEKGERGVERWGVGEGGAEGCV